ncbi:MAG: VWA domain-containing protein, partial [Amphiplicatus sp.]
YFHNCLYDYVWKDNKRRWTEKIPTWQILHKYPHDYKVIFIGDASMSPYEITVPGGAVEYFNEEPGALWLKRTLDIYERAVWLNPVPQKHWDYAPSIKMVRDLFGERMFPLTLGGIDKAMAELKR